MLVALLQFLYRLHICGVSVYKYPIGYYNIFFIELSSELHYYSYIQPFLFFKK